jgi:predicted glutamine amidotransferase
MTRAIAAKGEFNYLLSNGECLFAHCARRLAYLIRQAPFSSAHLKDEDVSVDFSEVTTPNDRVAIVATDPLTDNEVWTQVPPGTLLMLADGRPVKQATTAIGTAVQAVLKS